MIFFNNCCFLSGDKQSLSIFRQLGRFFRPPTILTIILLFVILSSSAVAHAVQVTLNLKSVPLETAFNEIKKQTGYGFWYEKKDLAELPKISIEVKNADLIAVMEACLKGQPLTYQVFDKTVVVKRRAATLPATIPVKKSLQEKVKGKVVDAQTKEPLAGVLVKVKSTAMSVVTNDKGEFELVLPAGKYDLLVQYLGYGVRELNFTAPSSELLAIDLNSTESTLNEVQVVNTGYQSLPKERATGSFSFIDEKTIARSVSSDLLSRLNGVSNGLLFDSTVGNSTGISVRGRSTIFSNTTPLIVIDNFPFEGDLNTINPDVLESVTLLKDAAAASIWGVRAGNGVVVITTKKGRWNADPKVTFNGNVNIGEKPDLYYEPQLSSSEFIDLEKFLFEKGAYTATINNGFVVISPVVEILQKIKVDPGYTATGNAQIDFLRGIDNRVQREKYFFRNSSVQHYAADVAGGGNSQSYYFSVGYDKDLPTLVSRSQDRITLKANNNYSLLRGKLRINTDLMFSKSTNNNMFASGYVPFLPYERIADDNGNPLPTLRRGGLRSSYSETAGGGRLLDWGYRPLEELRNEGSTNTIRLVDYRLNIGVNYKVSNDLSFGVSYQYYNASSRTESLNDENSFYTRNLINSFSSVNASTGVVSRPIPLGTIYNPIFISRQSHYGRAQLEYNKVFARDHELVGIAGYEIRDDGNNQNSYLVYGYQPETGISAIVDQINLYPYFYNPVSASRISAPTNQSAAVNRYVSLYGNASYTYQGKYVLSGSFRKDESNLFGVKANQKGVPLWSTGLAWNIHKEGFYELDWMNSLQLKATYGYNGNVNNSISAYLTASPSLFNSYGVQYLAVVNPPNDNLRWERVKNLNTGLYFAILDNRFTGSVECYVKNGVDLIASSPIAPQVGVSLYTGNVANTRTNGVDLQLNTRILERGFRWTNHLIFNFAEDRITDYKMSTGSNANIVTGYTASLSPLPNYPINAVFGFKWAGLNATGNPLGYLNGQTSTDYAAILNSNDRSQLQFFGSATPTVFGSFRNTLGYGRLELSFNIIYKFNYFFRRSSVNYASLFSGTFLQRDYAQRWKNPGDELITYVPAMVYPNVPNRSDFYSYAAVLVERGDHIRLQDIQINYTFPDKKGRKAIWDNMNIYAYANHLGLIWRANKQGIDPDVRAGFPSPRSLAIGVRANF